MPQNTRVTKLFPLKH